MSTTSAISATASDPYSWSIQQAQIAATPGPPTRSQTTTTSQVSTWTVADTVTLSAQARAVLASGGANFAGIATVPTSAGPYSPRTGTVAVYAAGLNFSGDTLTGLDLQNAVLTNADLTGADLSGSDLRGANLQFAQLTNATLTGTDLRGADLTGASGLTAGQLQGAQRDASVSPNYSFQSLNGVDFTLANVQYASFAYSDLQGANFASTNLQGADFSNAVLTGANLAGANLSGANLSTAVGLTQSQVTGAITDSTTLLPWTAS
jgi:uncharacterized protein YjbI with pentapeptide repeats